MLLRVGDTLDRPRLRCEGHAKRIEVSRNLHIVPLVVCRSWGPCLKCTFGDVIGHPPAIGQGVRLCDNRGVIARGTATEFLVILFEFGLLMRVYCSDYIGKLTQ